MTYIGFRVLPLLAIQNLVPKPATTRNPAVSNKQSEKRSSSKSTAHRTAFGSLMVLLFSSLYHSKSCPFSDTFTTISSYTRLDASSVFVATNACHNHLKECFNRSCLLRSESLLPRHVLSAFLAIQKHNMEMKDDRHWHQITTKRPGPLVARIKTREFCNRQAMLSLRQKWSTEIARTRTLFWYIFDSHNNRIVQTELPCSDEGLSLQTCVKIHVEYKLTHSLFPPAAKPTQHL